MAVAMDVADERQVEAGVEAVIKRFGCVDILVSNAGIQIVAPLDEFKFSDWKRLLAIHLDGAFLTRSEEHTSELQSLMRISYAVFCLKKKKKKETKHETKICYTQ